MSGERNKSNQDRNGLDQTGPQLAELLTDAYVENKRSLLALAINITRCQSLAEDAIQAAFSKLVKTQNPTTNLKAYLFQTVRNSALDIYRKKKREARNVESFFTIQTPDSKHNQITETDQIEELILKEELQSLRSAIDSLPSSDREIIVLKNYSGFTFEEIAEITKTNPNTVATRYRRLIQKLRKQLQHPVKGQA